MSFVGQQYRDLRKATFLGQWLRRGRQREATVTFNCQSEARTCSDGKEEEDDREEEEEEEGERERAPLM